MLYEISSDCGNKRASKQIKGYPSLEYPSFLLALREISRHFTAAASSKHTTFKAHHERTILCINRKQLSQIEETLSSG